MITATADNDILLKGAGYGLLTEMLHAIPADLHEVGVLGTAKYVVGSKLRQAQLPKALALFEQVIAQAQRIEPTPEEAALAAQLEYEAQLSNLSYHSGETLLCAIVIERGLDWMVTGDKRAIQALELLFALRQGRATLAGKVVCLEQIVLRLVNTGNPQAIRNAICTQPSLDKALALCFSCGSPELESDSYAEGLTSYIEHIRSAAPSILSR